MCATIAGILVLVLMLAGGCCQQRTKPVVPPPPPISLEDQLRQLNDRATALTNLKGHGKVTLTYFDVKGIKHKHDADGTLLLRQHPDDLANPADMLLLGRVVGQDAFEAGMNRTNYWMAVRLDVKRAFVGTVANMANVQIAAMPLRADRVVQLLAITPLRNGPQPNITMLVNDQNSTNEIFVMQASPNGGPYIEREIIVNRRTGFVDQVRLYNPDGTLLAKADLGPYRPSKIAENLISTPAQAVPMHIVIEYPDRDVNRTARVVLDLGDLTIVPPLSDKSFAMPEFEAQGLEVVDLDKGQ